MSPCLVSVLRILEKMIPQPCEGEQLLLSRLTGPETESEGHPHPTTPVGRLQQRSGPASAIGGSSKQTNPKKSATPRTSVTHIFPLVNRPLCVDPEADGSLLTTTLYVGYAPQQQ